MAEKTEGVKTRPCRSAALVSQAMSEAQQEYEETEMPLPPPVVRKKLSKKVQSIMPSLVELEEMSMQRTKDMHTTLTSPEGCVEETLAKVPPSVQIHEMILPGTDPKQHRIEVGLNHLLQGVKRDYLSFLDQIKTKAFSENVKKQINEEMERKRLLKNRKLDLEHEINKLAKQGVAIFQDELKKLEIVADTPEDFICKAKEIVSQHTKLERRTKSLEKEIRELEAEQEQLLKQKETQLIQDLTSRLPEYNSHDLRMFVRREINSALSYPEEYTRRRRDVSRNQLSSGSDEHNPSERHDIPRDQRVPGTKEEFPTDPEAELHEKMFNQRTYQGKLSDRRSRLEKSEGSLESLTPQQLSEDPRLAQDRFDSSLGSQSQHAIATGQHVAAGQHTAAGQHAAAGGQHAAAGGQHAAAGGQHAAAGGQHAAAGGQHAAAGGQHAAAGGQNAAAGHHTVVGQLVTAGQHLHYQQKQQLADQASRQYQYRQYHQLNGHQDHLMSHQSHHHHHQHGQQQQLLVSRHNNYVYQDRSTVDEDLRRREIRESRYGRYISREENLLEDQGEELMDPVMRMSEIIEDSVRDTEHLEYQRTEAVIHGSEPGKKPVSADSNATMYNNMQTQPKYPADTEEAKRQTYLQDNPPNSRRSNTSPKPKGTSRLKEAWITSKPVEKHSAGDSCQRPASTGSKRSLNTPDFVQDYEPAAKGHRQGTPGLDTRFEGQETEYHGQIHVIDANTMPNVKEHAWVGRPQDYAKFFGDTLQQEPAADPMLVKQGQTAGTTAGAAAAAQQLGHVQDDYSHSKWQEEISSGFDRLVALAVDVDRRNKTDDGRDFASHRKGYPVSSDQTSGSLHSLPDSENTTITHPRPVEQDGDMLSSTRVNMTEGGQRSSYNRDLASERNSHNSDFSQAQDKNLVGDGDGKEKDTRESQYEELIRYEENKSSGAGTTQPESQSKEVGDDDILSAEIVAATTTASISKSPSVGSAEKLADRHFKKKFFGQIRAQQTE